MFIDYLLQISATKHLSFRSYSPELFKNVYQFRMLYFLSGIMASFKLDFYFTFFLQIKIEELHSSQQDT